MKKGWIVMALAVAGSAAYVEVRGQEVAFTEVGYNSGASFNAAEVNASSEVVDFLLTATDVRLMNIEEASMATRKAGSKEIRQYAGKFANDQRMMLGYIKKLALLRGLNLPDEISEDNKDGCDKLAGLSGKRFDRKFVKRMINYRKRDLDLFRSAANSSDYEVREFARAYVPVIEDQLKRMKELKRVV